MVENATQENQNVVSPELEQDNGENESVADTLGDEDSKKALQTEIARKKHWREKFQKADDARKKNEDELKKYRESPVNSPNLAASPDEIESVLSLRSEGYSDSEVLTLRKYAKRMNMPISEVARDPFIKSGFEAERAKAKVAQATPSPTNRSFSSQGKSWGEMDEENRKKNFDNLKTSFRR